MIETDCIKFCVLVHTSLYRKNGAKFQVYLNKRHLIYALCFNIQHDPQTESQIINILALSTAGSACAVTFKVTFSLLLFLPLLIFSRFSLLSHVFVTSSYWSFFIFSSMPLIFHLLVLFSNLPLFSVATSASSCSGERLCLGEVR